MNLQPAHTRKKMTPSFVQSLTLGAFSRHGLTTLKKIFQLERRSGQDTERYPLPFWTHNGRHSTCPAGLWKL